MIMHQGSAPSAPKLAKAKFGLYVPQYLRIINNNAFHYNRQVDGWHQYLNEVAFRSAAARGLAPSARGDGPDGRGRE